MKLNVKIKGIICTSTKFFPCRKKQCERPQKSNAYNIVEISGGDVHKTEPLNLQLLDKKNA